MTKNWQVVQDTWRSDNVGHLTLEQGVLFSKAATSSEFFREQLQRNPEWLEQWVDALSSPLDVETELHQRLSDCQSDDEAMTVLRKWRNWHQCFLILNDTNRVKSTQVITSECTLLAEAAIRCSLAWLQPRLEKRYGIPQSCPFEPNQPQQLSVIAMGKMGAKELNLSSDIDLIFAFPTEGETLGENPITHTDFFIRLGRLVVKLLDTHDANGFVYRVDMRLRPWGQSGPLATTFNFLRKYYPEQGRDWERFAMIKARVVAGSESASIALTEVFHDFVYRRYVDYQALQALRKTKKMIIKEVRKQGQEHNIKLGDGGIREIEFIAQAFQLIRGGQVISLQNPNIWHVFQCIRDEELLPLEVINELQEHYEFLRNLEHAIQCWQDRQTQLLPPINDDNAWSRLAWVMGFDGIDSFKSRLDLIRKQVSFHFNAFIQLENEATASESSHWQSLWLGDSDDEHLSAELIASVRSFRESNAVARMQPESRERLDQFMPRALKELSAFKSPDPVWNRLQPLLETVLRRTSYLLMLTEEPESLRLILRMLGLSSWMAETLTTKPYLLDEFSDQNSLFKLPNRQTLDESIHQRMIGLPEDDLEVQMETLRHFRHGWVLRAAACDLDDMLPLMKISDYLANIAEVILEQAFWTAWRQLTARHGKPHKTSDEVCNPNFGIVGYGKLGGLELSYESDLDLVFLHNADSRLETEGPRVIDNPVFFMRLGQKIIHILSTQTQSGDLYEVDMRLRPSGNKGLLVSTLESFEKYQNKEAWTWEHQALVRARFVAGDDSLKQEFAQTRHRILSQPRDLPQLQDDVRKMRKKMRDHLGTPERIAEQEQLLNLKQDPGGIVDIEFMVQFGVLAWAQYLPELTRWSDNVRLIKDLQTCGFFSEHQAKILLDAYLFFREKAHFAMLQQTSVKKLKDSLLNELAPYRQNVISVWKEIMELPPTKPDNTVQ